MTSLQPMIKIIPQNPATHSILIVYCYANNKTLQCQAKWSRVDSPQQSMQNRKNESTISKHTGKTYKCTSLDFNHVIQVETACEYMGKEYKLTARTHLVKCSKQLMQRKVNQKTVNCKISNFDFEIQCTVGLQSSKSLQLISDQKQFSLQLLASQVVNISCNSFKTRINSNRYQFLNFFQQCTDSKQNYNAKHSLANLFEFTFVSEADKDLVLTKIAQISTFGCDSINDIPTIRSKQISSYQELPSNTISFPQNTPIKIELRSKDNIDLIDKKYINTIGSNPDKKQYSYGLKISDPKLPTLNPFPVHMEHKDNRHSEQHGVKESDDRKKGNLKISEKPYQRNQKEISQNLNTKSHQYIKIRDQMSVPPSNVNSESKDKKKPNAQKKPYRQFLNIFDEQQPDTEMEAAMKSSSPQVYRAGSSKNRSVSNNIDIQVKTEGKQDLPSINLRGSFQQLQKVVDESLPIKNTKWKVKTETCRNLSYQYPKSNQKPGHHRNPPNDNMELFNEEVLMKKIHEITKKNQSIKKENIKLKKQVESQIGLTNENNLLQKKCYDLNLKVNKLELQKKQILADKIKFQSNYHKQKTEKQHLKKQIQQLMPLISKNSFSHQFQGPFWNKLQKTQHTKLENDPQPLNQQRINPQKIKSVIQTRKKIVQDQRDKTPPNKVVSQNPYILEDMIGVTSNRKQLRFPSYSLKLNSFNSFSHPRQ